MKKFLTTLLCLSMLTSTMALATTHPNPPAYQQHHGFYIGANLGTNLYYVGIISTAGSNSSSGIDGLGWSANLGYNFTSRIAIEGGFMQNFISDKSNDPNDYIVADTDIPYIAASFTVPFCQRFAFLAKVGGMYLSLKKTIAPMDHRTTGIVLPFIGIGTSYAVTHHIDINVQYQGAIYGVAGAGLLSGGLTYHF